MNFRNRTSVFRKNNWSEYFWKLTSKTSMVESVLSTLVGLPGSFPKSILEQLFCREPDDCFSTKELCSRHYLKNLPEFLKHKVEDCSLHTCNLLKRNFNTELFLNIFQYFQNTCKKFGRKLVFSSVGTCSFLKKRTP